MDDSSTDVLNDIDALLNKLKHLPDGSRRDVLNSLQARLRTEVPTETDEQKPHLTIAVSTENVEPRPHLTSTEIKSPKKGSADTPEEQEQKQETIDSQTCEKETVIILQLSAEQKDDQKLEGLDVGDFESVTEDSIVLKKPQRRSPRKKLVKKKVVLKEQIKPPQRRVLSLPSRYSNCSGVPSFLFTPKRESNIVLVKETQEQKVKFEASEPVKECQVIVTKTDENSNVASSKVEEYSEVEDATFGAKILLAAAERNEIEDLNSSPQVKAELVGTKTGKRKRRKKHSDEDKTCPVCQRTYVNASYLRVHMRKHTGEKPYQCERCGKSFSQKSSLWVHMKRHDGKYDHQCTQCDYKSVLKIDLDRHMPKHTGAKIYICELCGKMFTTDMRLKDHIRHVHERKETHICDKCGFSTHRPDNLRRHIAVKHSDDEFFKCPVCGDVLKQRWTFIVHLRRHTGERPHVCSECQKGFKSLSQLAVHRRTHKEGEHHCPDCNRKFKTKYHLIRHSVIHSGEKPFACPHCPYTCNVKGNINKHMKTVHKLSNFSFRRLKKLDGTVPPPLTNEESEKSAIERGEQVTQDFLNRISLRKDENLTVEALQQMITKEPDVEEKPVIKPARCRPSWVKKKPTPAANRHTLHQSRFRTYDLTAGDEEELATTVLHSIPEDEHKVEIITDLDYTSHEERQIITANGYPVTCVITSNGNDVETHTNVTEANSCKQPDENCGDLLLFSVKECLGEQVTTVESTDSSTVMHLPLQVQVPGDVCMNQEIDTSSPSTICYVIQVAP